MTTIPRKHNFFAPGENSHSRSEIFETLVRTPDLFIEKIVSNGQSTPSGEWYDQEQDEWVILLSGTATLIFEKNGILEMNSGDYLLIPAHCRHRVEQTSEEPNCIWLAINYHGHAHDHAHNDDPCQGCAL
jgi:cupin 2 domain-containing protein